MFRILETAVANNPAVIFTKFIARYVRLSLDASNSLYRASVTVVPDPGDNSDLNLFIDLGKISSQRSHFTVIF